MVGTAMKFRDGEVLFEVPFGQGRTEFYLDFTRGTLEKVIEVRGTVAVRIDRETADMIRQKLGQPAMPSIIPADLAELPIGSPASRAAARALSTANNGPVVKENGEYFLLISREFFEPEKARTILDLLEERTRNATAQSEVGGAT
jgi:hypothetical protein